MNTMAILIRREFWEHRVFLWLPLVLCALFLLACIAFGANFAINTTAFPGAMPGGRRGFNVEDPGFVVGLTAALPLLVTSLMAVVTFFYVCDSLYADRKDRSILFWKSLPVSDAMTVLSKMLVALVAVPLLVYVIAFVTNLLVMLVFKVSTGVDLFPSPYTAGTWLQVNGYLLLRLIVMALWYAPIVAYQLLISVSVPRMPVVWTLLPPLVLIFGERMFLGTWNIGLFVAHRLGGPGSDQNLALGIGGVRGEEINPLPMLAQVDLWGGVAVAAVLVYATIYIRRHRSDS